MADGIVAEAQDTEAAQLGQALLIQPSEVVEGQNPGKERRVRHMTIRLCGCSLHLGSHATPGLTSPERGYLSIPTGILSKSGHTERNPSGQHLSSLITKRNPGQKTED